MTSIGGKISVPHMLPHSASAFAPVVLSEGLHAGLRKDNITVTTVVPYLMRTGSPRQITVKGNHDAEYAWFKTLSFMPLIVQDAGTAANKIVHAAKYNQPYASPGWMNLTLAIMNDFLPAMKAGGKRGKKGYGSESKLSQNFITAGDEKLVARYNER